MFTFDDIKKSVEECVKNKLETYYVLIAPINIIEKLDPWDLWFLNISDVLENRYDDNVYLMKRGEKFYEI